MSTLNLEAAAVLVRLHPNTLRERAARGLIPGAKPGKEWVFIEADLLAYLRGEYVEKKPCQSRSAKAVRSTGPTFVTPGNGYVGQLERLIAQRRKSASAKSR